MTTYRVIDKGHWHRLALFDFYRKFANPCFNLCVPLKAQPLYENAKDNGISFFQLTLYAILRAANHVPQLKQRLVADEIIEYSAIDVMTPIMTNNDAFRQILCTTAQSFNEFTHVVSQQIALAKSTEPAPLLTHGDNYFCASSLPWLHFTGMTHAEYFSDSTVPTLTWGKLENGVIPVAGKFNHMFVDGLHASRFFTELEALFLAPERLWTPESA